MVRENIIRKPAHSVHYGLVPLSKGPESQTTVWTKRKEEDENSNLLINFY